MILLIFFERGSGFWLTVIICRFLFFGIIFFFLDPFSAGSFGVGMGFWVGGRVRCLIFVLGVYYIMAENYDDLYKGM